VRVAQMGMGVVTVAAQRGNSQGTGSAGTAGLVIVTAPTAAAMTNNAAGPGQHRASDHENPRSDPGGQASDAPGEQKRNDGAGQGGQTRRGS